VPTVPDPGARLFVREAGAGPPLLILPGNTASSACHASEIAHFARRFRTIAVDLPGTGRSERLAVWPRDWWAASAAAVVDLLDSLRIDRCAMAGTSGGAVVALLAAIAAPARVAAVVADSVVAHLPATAVQAQVAARVERTPSQQAFWALAHGEDWAQPVDADSAMLAGYSETGIDFFGGRLGEASCPVLLTASLADDALPDVGKQLCAMVQALPRASLFLADAGGHPLMWSRPEVFRPVADAFLDPWASEWSAPKPATV
jgi:pimeloyl-ACP methyl ester carboxylesterase